MTKNPTLYVIGAGAMGSLFGGLLSEGGLGVTLIDPWREHVDAVNANGLKMIGYGGDRVVPVKAVTTANGLPPADLVFVQCKSYHTVTAMVSASHVVGPQTAVTSFQNGLGNEELLAEIVGNDRVLGGLTAQGASIEGPGLVHNYAELPSWIGEMPKGDSERATNLARMLSAHGLPTSASDYILQDIWKKLMVNVGINALSGIANLKINAVMKVPEMRLTVYEAIDEAVTVARKTGLVIDSRQAHGVLDKIAGPDGSGENRSSLCNDLLKRRQTEIDYINGAIVKLGTGYGIETPVNSTLVAAVKGLESHFVQKKINP